MEHEGDTNCKWCARDNAPRIGKGMKDLEIRRQDEATQTITLLGSARRVQKTWGNLLSLKFSGKQSANAGMKNSQRSKIIIIKHCDVSGSV